MWQLGLLLYNMLVGHIPFPSLEAVAAGRQPDWAALSLAASPAASNLVQSCLAAQPGIRLPLAAIPLHPWLDNQPLNTNGADDVGGIK